MNKIPDEGLIMTITATEPCRVAYAIDNRQPVRCTLIGDQPLFYMDFEEAVTEDAFDDGFSFAAIEKSLQELREKIAQLEELSPAAMPAAGLLTRFSDTATSLTTPQDISAATPSPKILEALLRKSRLATALLDLGANFGTVLKYSRQQPGAAYDRRCGTIFIHPDLSLADQTLLAARELRRLWQHRQGALLHPLTFHPDQAILINRAQVADLTVAMVRIAWELQLAGEKGPWVRIETSSLGDLARAFARESLMDFRTLNNGCAAAAVFETWFLSERCRAEDRKLIQQMLADYRGYVFGNAEISQHLSAELINALGSMPFGKNYLSPYAQTVVKDPVFTEVRDRSNANFLWFIKFERSFRETEAELHTHGLDVPDTVKRSKGMKTPPAGLVVQFPTATRSSQRRVVGRRSGQVVAFRAAAGPAEG